MSGGYHSTGQHIEGFKAPIHGSLGSPILLGAAPRGLAIVIGTIAARCWPRTPVMPTQPRNSPTSLGLLEPILFPGTQVDPFGLLWNSLWSSFDDKPQ